MSDPTYRIDVAHEPQQAVMPWVAKIVRLSDETYLDSRAGQTSGEAVRRAQEWIVREFSREQGFSVLVDDDGRPVEGHSVKA